MKVSVYWDRFVFRDGTQLIRTEPKEGKVTDVNERIAKALGGEVLKRVSPEGFVKTVVTFSGASEWESLPDFAHSIDACMRVIQARWPRADVMYQGVSRSWLIDWGIWATSAESLALALAEALEDQPDRD